MASNSSVSADGPSQEPDRLRATEVARVQRWRGYTKSKFVLNAADGVVCESAPFRWRHAGPPPDEGDARAAYDSFVEQLLSEGWTFAEHGPTWCETSFERPALVVEPPVVPVAAEPPAAPDLPPQLLRRVEAPAPAPPLPPRSVELPAPPPQQSVDAPPPRIRARRVPWAAAAALGSGAVGFAAGALFVGGGHDHATRVTSLHTVAAARASTTSAAPASPPKRPAAPLDIVIVGVRRDGSWLEARRGSQKGKVLFSGVVAPGQRVHLRGRRVWARFGAAGNVAITVDGRPVTLMGTYDKTFVSRG